MKPLAPVGVLVADGFGQDALQCRLRRAAVVFSDPAGELENFRRHQRLGAEHLQDRFEPGVR